MWGRYRVLFYLLLNLKQWKYIFRRTVTILSDRDRFNKVQF